MKKRTKLFLFVLTLSILIGTMCISAFAKGSDLSKNDTVNSKNDNIDSVNGTLSESLPEENTPTPSDKVVVKFFDGEKILSEEQYDIGAEVKIPEVPETKVENGTNYIFKGWADDKETNNIVTVSKAEADKTYYAIYIDAVCEILRSDGKVETFKSGTDISDLLPQLKNGDTLLCYTDFECKGYSFVESCTVDLNGHKMTMTGRMTGRAQNFVMKNGHIDTRNINLIYLSYGGSTYTVENCTVEGTGSFIDMRDGNIVFKDCKLIGKPSSSGLINLHYRGTKNTLTFDNCEISTERRPHLISSSRAGGENKPIDQTVRFINGTTIGEGFQTFYFGNNATSGNSGSKVRLEIDGTCKILDANMTVTSSNVKNINLVLGDGLKLKKMPEFTGILTEKENLTLGDGNSVLLDIKDGDYRYEVIAKSDMIEITWQDEEGRTKVEKIKKGNLPAVPYGKGWRFVSDMEILPAENNTTYTGKYVFDEFKVLHNLTLYSDFTFNIYISENAGLISVDLDGVLYTDFVDLPKWKDCNVLTVKGINPTNGARDIKVKATFEGPYENVEKLYTVSIVSYCEAVMRGSFSSQAKHLTADVLNYIDKAYIAYQKTADSAYQKIEKIRPLIDTYKTEITTETTEVSMSDMAVALESAQLNLNTASRFRFNIQKGYTGKVTLTYAKGGNLTTDFYYIENGTCDGKNYIELDIRAFDMSRDITASCTTDSGTKYGRYNLQAYLDSVKGDKDFEPLITALFAYSKSSYNYKTANKTQILDKVTVAENDIKNYTLVFDYGNAYVADAAANFHSRIYRTTGIFMTVAPEKVTENAVYIRLSDKIKGIKVEVKNGDMYIECSIEGVFPSGVLDFLNTHISYQVTGSIDFKNGFTYEKDIGTISYCEYGGAIGDGIHDDFEAIKKTHERANLTGETVVANPGKTFNLGQHTQSIIIKSNVIWTDAKFIIDDSKVNPKTNISKTHVFLVSPEDNSTEIKGITSLKKGQKNIGVTLKKTSLVRIVNTTVKQYIRYGANENSGTPMQEVILVHKNGDVDPSTPIMWNYDTVTSARAYPCEDKSIIIDGGEFTTVANQAPREYTYYARGIRVSRSNVTIKNLKHFITGEGENGAPYNGFLDTTFCNNILYQDVVLTGHKVYKLQTDNRNSMGTYDISGSNANNITWRNVTQTNSITDSRYWGIMGTNFCKNLTYDGCKLSRFDAHQGVYNATIINSELGHQRINAIGMGTLRIENTAIHGNTAVNLRSDYGSTWDGDLILKNITMQNSGTVTLVGGSWTNHNFGYTCHLPKNITVDGITLKKNAEINILGTFAGNSLSVDQPEVNGQPNKNPYVLTEKVTLISNPNNYKITLSQNKNLFKNTVFEIK